MASHLSKADIERAAQSDARQQADHILAGSPREEIETIVTRDLDWLTQAAGVVAEHGNGLTNLASLKGRRATPRQRGWYEAAYKKELKKALMSDAHAAREEAPRGGDRVRWNKLQADFNRLNEEAEAVKREAHVKYGPDGLRYASRALQSKHEKLKAQRDRVYEKLWAMVRDLSPRDWSSGVPAFWIASTLSYDDLVRPLNEPLSVIPPLAYGATRPMQEEASRKTSRKTKTHDLEFAGYRFRSGPEDTTVERSVIDTSASGDYGADPLGDGRFRMVPSGDIVDFEERNRRLAKRGAHEGSARPLSLWRLHPRSGLWEHQRTILDEAEAQQWLERFQQDEPGVTFKLSRNKPPLGSREEAAPGRAVTRTQAAAMARALNARHVNLEQLRRGMEVEQEHTQDLRAAAKIAIDHLREKADYYTRLDRAGLEADEAPRHRSGWELRVIAALMGQQPFIPGGPDAAHRGSPTDADQINLAEHQVDHFKVKYANLWRRMSDTNMEPAAVAGVIVDVMLSEQRAAHRDPAAPLAPPRADEPSSEAAEGVPAADALPWVKVARDPERYAEAMKQAAAIGPVESTARVYELLSPVLSKEDQEVFLVMMLDVRGNLRGVTEVHRGSRSRVSVSPADILRVVITTGAEAFIVVHNHPTGKAEPSAADESLTEAIRAAAEPLKPDVIFLDHVVIGSGEYYSFSDKKLSRA